MISLRLASLRKEMISQNIDALIIPSNDPNQSEYPPKYWAIRQWITGFTGSTGLAVVTQTEAGLWTDSRYFIQAESQLNNTEIKLHKVHNRSSPGYIEWIITKLHKGQTVAVLSELCAFNDFKNKSKLLQDHNISLKAIDDPFIKVWLDRPEMPLDPVYEHETKFSGVSRNEKIEQLRNEMRNHKCNYHLINTLDDIAWTLNLRGSDVECNPVFVGYLMIGINNTTLYINPSKISEDLKKKLQADHVIVLEYSDLEKKLNQLTEEDSILLDLSLININIHDSINNAQIVSQTPPSINLKAIKSNHEIEQYKSCMIRDGVALCHAFIWLEKTLKNNAVSEFDFANKIAEFRSQQLHYKGESFYAIVGYESNGAIVHYRPEENSCKQIEHKGILLVDCGGQYLDGTTDITRTIALSIPSPEQKLSYTSVLKGHIALATAVFPEDTPGTALDTLARQFLWQNGLNYSHGTGHGVGFFNSVHEGPQSFAPNCSGRGNTLQKPGMVTSNEPGYYEEGAYGIRIENLVHCRKSRFDGFLEFETITLFPIDTKLIDLNMLNANEKKWLNEYHNLVYLKLSSHLNDQDKQWLKDKCQNI